MACVLYVLYFGRRVSRSQKRQARSALDYFGSFFLIWFFLVGVWIIQPRINCLFAATVKQPRKPYAKSQDEITREDVIRVADLAYLDSPSPSSKPIARK